MARFCATCGGSMTEQAQFCGKCGAKTVTLSLAGGLMPVAPTQKPIPPAALVAVAVFVFAGGLYAAYSSGKNGAAIDSVAMSGAVPDNVVAEATVAKPAMQQVIVQIPAQPDRLNFGKYAETYPFNGFLSDPQVRRLMGAAVPNRQLVDEMSRREGPQAPIKAGGKYLLASGCEAHNCGGGYNWSVVLVDAKAGPFARLCIHDSARMGDYSEWYQNGRLKNRVSGECPSELAGVY